MKSIQINVPRNLIKKFYPHPEPYGDGDYVVDLINGMYTDVFYREEEDYITITNDRKLISYLKKNQSKPRDYFYRNGIYSFRQISDCDHELIEDWKMITPNHIDLNHNKNHTLPNEFMFCFYWIEVGKVTITANKISVDIYEKDLISKIDLDVAMNLLIDYMR